MKRKRENKKNLSEVNLTSPQRKILKNALTFVRNTFKDFENNGEIDHGGHGFDHVQRVSGMAFYLASQEKTDCFLPVLAAILHDIGRASSDPRSQNYLHGQLSRELSQDFMNKTGLPSNDCELVLNAIEDHTFLNGKVRQSYIAEILMDSDRLDGLGALAPVRASVYKWNLPIYKKDARHTTVDGKIDTVFGYFGGRVLEWPDMMWTKTGRHIAQDRVKFLKEFNKHFLSDINLALDAFEKLKLDV